MRAAGWRFVGTIAAIGVTAGVLATFMFGVPDALQRALARVTGIEALLPSAAVGSFRVPASRWPQDISLLPDAVRDALPDASGMARLAALRARPAVLIETATLVVPPGSGAIRINTPRLTLRDATIVLNGASLEIEAETVTATNSAILAFSGEGPPDQTVGSVRITLRGSVSGVLKVDLSGRPGLPGPAGAAGPLGSTGEKGAPARSARTECVRPAGRGGDGGTGGPGARGGAGSDGGAAGTLIVAAADPVGAVGFIQFAADGGAPGPGGAGGAGGAGGPGGAGGDPAGVCFGNGARGATGQAGPVGAAGPAGRRGAEGSFAIESLPGS